MKKAAAIATGAIATFFPAFPAFAGVAVNPCPDDGLQSNLCNLNADDFGTFISQLITFLIVAAILIAVFFLVWGGIKWILSGGDKSKVEGARNTIIGAIIGLVIVFLAYFVISLVAKAFGIDIGNLVLPTFGV